MKNKNWLLLLFVLISVFFVSFSLDLLEVYDRAIFVTIWFIVTLFFMSLYLLYRAIKFKIDSSLYIGVLLLGIAVIILVWLIANISLFYFWPYIFLAFALAHLSVRLYFFDRQHTKFIFADLMTFVISILFVYNAINLLWFLLSLCTLMSLWVFLYFVISNRS